MQMDHQERRTWVRELARMLPSEGEAPEWRYTNASQSS